MSEYTAQVSWSRAEDEKYLDNKYSRAHEWHFDGGVTVPASSSPHIVPLPYSDESNVDPEEAFVAALSSCHMLVFLSIAAKQSFIVDSYIDNAMGVMAKNDEGQFAMTKASLSPLIQFSGENLPSPEQIDMMHHEAHEQCFIANSVKTEITIQAGV